MPNDTTQPAPLQVQLDMIAPYLPKGVEAFIGDDGDLDGGPMPVLFLGKETMAQTGEDSWEPDSEVWEPEEEDLWNVIRAMNDHIKDLNIQRLADRLGLCGELVERAATHAAQHRQQNPGTPIPPMPLTPIEHYAALIAQSGAPTYFLVELLDPQQRVKNLTQPGRRVTHILTAYGRVPVVVTEYAPLNAQAEAQPQVVYAERAEYRDPTKEVTLVGRVFPEGVRIGCQALEPWYATGVLIPPTHPAYMPAQQFLAALATPEVQK